MSTNMLNMPINIPWKLIAVSPDMMDTKFRDKKFPHPWKSSIAISAYEPNPEELPKELCGDRITYLKVTCSITGYQPSEEETKHGYVTFNNVPEEVLDGIFANYFACYGVLLNVAVFPYNPRTGHVSNVKLAEYPHIIGFEPKVRDFYQAATEAGEVLTSSQSRVNTDKTLTNLESTESGTSFEGSLYWVPKQIAGSIGAMLSGSTSRKRLESDEERWTVQTDASRERRETRGTTTQLTQMGSE